METFSALLATCAGNSPVPGEFPAQRAMTQSFDVFFDLRLNKRLRKQSWGWWFDTLLCPLWRHWNVCMGYLSMFGTPFFMGMLPRDLLIWQKSCKCIKSPNRCDITSGIQIHYFEQTPQITVIPIGGDSSCKNARVCIACHDLQWFNCVNTVEMCLRLI